MERHEQRATDETNNWSVERNLSKQCSQLQEQHTGNGDSLSQNDQDEPVASNFNVPVDEAEQEELIAKMMECGMSYADAASNIEKRKKLFNQAVKKYVSANKANSRRGRQTKSRKDSLNDQL